MYEELQTTIEANQFLAGRCRLELQRQTTASPFTEGPQGEMDFANVKHRASCIGVGHMRGTIEGSNTTARGLKLGGVGQNGRDSGRRVKIFWGMPCQDSKVDVTEQAQRCETARWTLTMTAIAEDP